jgi:predicted metal-dependent phosphotriesterase family hydrolase
LASALSVSKEEVHDPLLAAFTKNLREAGFEAAQIDQMLIANPHPDAGNSGGRPS